MKPVINPEALETLREIARSRRPSKRQLSRSLLSSSSSSGSTLHDLKPSPHLGVGISPIPFTLRPGNQFLRRATFASGHPNHPISEESSSKLYQKTMTSKDK